MPLSYPTLQLEVAQMLKLVRLNVKISWFGRQNFPSSLKINGCFFENAL
jgi:hypothetical protein